MSKVVSAALIVCCLSTAVLAHATRVAVVFRGDSRAGEICALTGVQLSSTAGIELVERQNLDKILAEQTLAGSGEIDAATAIQIGKLARADVLASIEADSTDKHVSASLVIFDTVSGVRLCDVALTDDEVEAQANASVSAIRNALQKRAGGAKARTVCLLTVRNVDLPAAERGVCDGIGALLERSMIDSPQITLLERERLEQVNRERAVSTDSGETSPLLASVVTLEMDVARSGAATDKGIQATASLYDLNRRPLGQASAVGDIAHLRQLAASLADAVLARLAVAPIAADPRASDLRVQQEAMRFCRESHFRATHSDWAEAAVAAEAAHALDPNEPRYEVELASALIMQGVALAEAEENRARRAGTAPPELGPALRILRRGADELGIAGSSAGAPRELAPAVEQLENFLAGLHRGADDRGRRTPDNQPYAADRYSFNDEQVEDLQAILREYRAYSDDIEEPAVRAAVKDNETFLAYTRLLDRILGDECHLFARTSNDFTGEIARRFPAWATLAGKYWRPTNLRGPVEQLDDNLRVYWTTVRDHAWGMARWVACWPTLDPQDIANWEAAAASIPAAHPPEQFFPGLERWISNLEAPSLSSAASHQPSEPTTVVTVPKDVGLAYTEKLILVDLAGQDRDLTSVSQPAVANDAVYALVAAPVDSGSEVRLLKFSDQGRGQRTVVSRLLPPEIKSASGQAPHRLHLFSDLHWLCSGHFVTSESYGDHRLFVLPLGEGKSRAIDAATELPGTWVHAAADLGDTIYLEVTSEGDHGAYLVSYDLKDGSVRTLISSRRQEQASPFDNMAPMEMNFIVSDPPRQRILFYVHNSDWDKDKIGLWEYSERSGQFKKLLGTTDPSVKGAGTYQVTAGLPTDGAFVFRFREGSVVYDLNTDVMHNGLAGANGPAAPRTAAYPLWNHWWQAYGAPGQGASNGDRTIAQRIGDVHALRRLAAGAFPPYSQMLGNRVLVADETGVWILTPR